MIIPVAQRGPDMLREFTKLRQEKTGFRRLFRDAFFDLYVWYDREGGSITGFQLVYGKDDSRRALTWTDTGGLAHDRVQISRRYPHGGRGAGFLVKDGYLDRDRLAGLFKGRSSYVDTEISDLVYSTIKDYNRQL
jgi:hypothetical protein